MTEPEELAIGLAVALTPPTPSARAELVENKLALVTHKAAAVLDNLLLTLPIA